METGALTGVLQPTGDGGLYVVVGDDGTTTTYDAAGSVVDTIVTPATSPDTVALDPTGTRLAIGSDRVRPRRSPVSPGVQHEHLRSHDLGTVRPGSSPAKGSSFPGGHGAT